MSGRGEGWRRKLKKKAPTQTEIDELNAIGAIRERRWKWGKLLLGTGTGTGCLHHFHFPAHRDLGQAIKELTFRKVFKPFLD